MVKPEQTLITDLNKPLKIRDVSRATAEKDSIIAAELKLQLKQRMIIDYSSTFCFGEQVDSCWWSVDATLLLIHASYYTQTTTFLRPRLRSCLDFL